MCNQYSSEKNWARMDFAVEVYFPSSLEDTDDEPTAFDVNGKILLYHGHPLVLISELMGNEEVDRILNYVDKRKE